MKFTMSSRISLKFNTINDVNINSEINELLDSLENKNSIEFDVREIQLDHNYMKIETMYLRKNIAFSFEIKHQEILILVLFLYRQNNSKTFNRNIEIVRDFLFDEIISKILLILNINTLKKVDYLMDFSVNENDPSKAETSYNKYITRMRKFINFNTENSNSNSILNEFDNYSVSLYKNTNSESFYVSLQPNIGTKNNGDIFSYFEVSFNEVLRKEISSDQLENLYMNFFEKANNYFFELEDNIFGGIEG